MKKLLPLAILATQIISCGMGTIETQPEATKLKIQNRSAVDLSNVKWNGYNFGSIDANDFSEEVFVSDGKGPVSFEVANKKYNTCGTALAEVKKHERKNFLLGPSTPLESSEKRCAAITLDSLRFRNNPNAN